MRFPNFDFQAGTFDIGRFGRAPIELHASFFLAGLALTLPFWKRGTLSGLALAVIGIAAIFGSILVHELAHALYARRYNIPVSRIDIHFFGGTVQFGWRPPQLSQDLALTFAGPTSNLILAGICWKLLQLVPEGATVRLGGFDPVWFIASAISFAMYINLGLGLINLLPAFPLDGGWMAYRFLTQRVGRRNAGLIVGSLGVVLATLSTLVLLGSLLAGMAIYAPPDFRSNLEALRAARRGEPVLV
jgi:Zn-dependent protease